MGDGRAVEHLDEFAPAQRSGALEQIDGDVEAVGRRGRRAGPQHAARWHLVPLDTDERNGHAAAGAGALGVRAVDLQRAHARLTAGGLNRHGLADGERARPERPRHHGADAVEGEGAVDGEAHAPGVVARRRLRGGRGDGGDQRVESAAGGGGDRDDRGVGERRAGECGADARLGGAASRVIDEVGLRQCHHRVLDAEQREDREVLDGLWHHSVVGGDADQREVDAGGTADHRPHEALVAGDIHDAEPQVVVERELRVAEHDRDAPPPLLLEPVGIDAGQRAHERRLAVVDVAGGPEREVAGHRQALTRAAMTATSASSSSVRQSSSSRPSSMRPRIAGSPVRRAACSEPS